MFFKATNANDQQILINTDAIAYVELNADVGGFYEDDPNPGVKIYFQTAKGKEGERKLHCEEFIGDVAQRMREGLPKLLEAPTFD